MAQVKASTGARLLALCAAVGLAVSVYDYFSPDSGIDGTGGVELVIASSILILLASLALARWPALPDLLRGLLVVLLFLGLIGTGAAAWFLESDALLAAMAVGLIGWLLAVAGKKSGEAS